ncbi:MAG: GAF domain-containing protein [Ardenticatenaceae bacterium]|nr:GAF domain-containing protein [Ardenticatenaceae bacterium]
MSLDNEIYRALAEQTADHILVTDVEGSILYVNPAFTTVTGYKPAEVLGKNPRILKSGMHDTAFYENLWQTVLSGETFRGMSVNKKKDGSLYYEEKTITPIKNTNGVITHLISTGKDVTERVAAEQDLTTINAIATSLHRAPDLQTVVTRATEAIVEYTAAPTVALFLLDETGKTLELAASHGFSVETLEVGSKLPVEGSLSGITIREKQVVNSNAIMNDERMEPTVRRALAKQGLHNAVSLPLLFQEDVLGVVNLVFTESQTLSTQNKETLLLIGKTIGLAVVNARRLENILKNEAQAQLRLSVRQALITARTQAEVFDAIIEKAAYFPKTAISLFILNYVGNTAVLELKKTDPAQSGLSRMPLGTQIPEEHLPNTFMSDQPFVTDDIVNDKRTVEGAKTLASKFGAVSLAVFPLRAAGTWLGLLILASPEKAYFTEDKLTIYRDLAEQGALALRAILLYDEARAALTRREREVALTVQVAQEIASATNLHDLYQRVVTQVQEQFGYYYTQLLRYDDSMDTLVLVVGYGDAGEKMLAMNHSMPMGVGLIGKAAQTREPVLRAHVATDPNWQSNPLLPETASELAVPIKLGEQVLGVLDVQSSLVNGLSANDQLLLEGLCGQIAIAIESTRLRQEMESRLRELSLLQRQMSREGWQKYQQTQHERVGYSFDLTGLQLLTTQQDAANIRSQNGTSPLANQAKISKPLTIRGEAIGSFGVEEDPTRPLSDEEREIIDAVAQELAEALEAARLFEQTQIALAEQERLASELETVAQVSTAASTILEVDELLQSVVDLAKSSFGLYHVHIYLTSETGKKLQLKAGAGNIGRLMSLEGREINIDAESIVSRAARTQKGVLENNVRRTVDFLPHPLLPETRAEMALPMLVGGKLIGVLDLQSDKEEYFTQEDLNVQTTLAAQIAVAVENANQYAVQVQTSTKLREVDILKSEFLASMSHELRTPLNSIIGFADVLLEGLDGDLNERMEEDVRLIRESGNHLRGLIGDILDMSKIEAGRMDLRYEEINMAQLANDVVATAAPLAQEKQLFLHLDIDEEVRSVQADRTRLRQVLWNIVGNAIKFTEKGSVTISVQAQPNHVLCSVRDTGIGIKEEHAPAVFEQFRQIDGGLNRAAGGTGLGMPITKKLIELHGGEIWLESVYGQGSTFLFTIPYEPPQVKPNAAKTASAVA